MHHAGHLVPGDLERHAVVDGRGGRQPQSRNGGKRFLSDEVAGREERDCGLFAVLRDDGEFSPACLEVKDGVGLISLGEKSFFWLQFDDFPSKAGVGKKSGAVKSLGFSVLQNIAPI